MSKGRRIAIGSGILTGALAIAMVPLAYREIIRRERRLEVEFERGIEDRLYSDLVFYQREKAEIIENSLDKLIYDGDIESFKSEVKRVADLFDKIYQEAERKGKFTKEKYEYKVMGFADLESFLAWLRGDEEYLSDCLRKWWPWHAAGAASRLGLSRERINVLYNRDYNFKQLHYIGSSLTVVIDRKNGRRVKDWYMIDTLWRAMNELNRLKSEIKNEKIFDFLRRKAIDRYKEFSYCLEKMPRKEKEYFESISN